MYVHTCQVPTTDVLLQPNGVSTSIPYGVHMYLVSRTNYIPIIMYTERAKAKGCSMKAREIPSEWRSTSAVQISHPCNGFYTVHTWVLVFCTAALAVRFVCEWRAPFAHRCQHKTPRCITDQKRLQPRKLPLTLIFA